MNFADDGYIKGLRRLCDEKDILLILDEVQTGMGRTGRTFCYEHYGIVPDVMTLAKTLGGGVPIGAMVARAKFQDVLTPGTHASTFGGSPIVSAAALAVFDAIKSDKLLLNANRMGTFLRNRLEDLKSRHHIIKEIRSMALTIGVELSVKGGDIVKQCMAEGLLINCTQDTVLRIMPPLTVTKKEINTAAEI